MELERVLGKSPTRELLDWQSDVEGKTVLVTGAGGSIARGLLHRLRDAGCAKIILVDTSEYALYEAMQELNGQGVPLLCSYGSDRARDALELYEPAVVFHVGAYKHVPLVERNPLEAVRNNVLEFLPLARACRVLDCKMVVVSTDKAVRPTNVMGATKKLVEDIALAFGPEDTRVVRFGNVMWSSGSVLPLFREQLTSGKPVTLTHEDVDRYFMTCGQAVSLILQSLKLGRRGIYALDMGEPVKIKHVVEKLAEELGVVRYEIKVVGLRHGEKLHEELTLGENLEPTAHPEIMLANEQQLERATLAVNVSALAEAVRAGEVGEVRVLLQTTVSEYRPSCGIVDDLWLEQNVFRALPELEDSFSPTKPAE